MATRFTPLVLLAQLHELPQCHSQRIRTDGVEGDITAQQHLNRLNGFCDLEEIDYEDAKMILFVERLRSGSEVLKLGVFMIFKSLR